MNRRGSLNNNDQMEEMTAKSIESRKKGNENEKAGIKQAITKATANQFFETKAKTIYQNKHITQDILDYLTCAMFDKDPKSKTRWIETFIQSQLKEAATEPNSRAAERLANALFSNDIFDQISQYIETLNAHDYEFAKYLIRQTLYDRQQELYDNEIDKRILVINSRRSGKTECMGRLIAKALLRPDAHVVYINRTSAAAIRQIKKPLEAGLNAAKQYLRLIKGSVAGQEMYFDNGTAEGSQLLIIGNNNSADTQKLRGERISLCIMDECGHQRNTRELIREVIGPALKDYADSQLIMVGTPPRIPHTFVEECWNNAAWKKYHWTFEDNPFIPNRDKVIEEVCAEFGVTPDSAFVQREYCGRMDAYDDDAKWIKKYSIVEQGQINKINTFSHAYVGVDWGYEDKAAVISVVCDNISKRAYVVDSWSEAKKGITEISKEIKRQVDNLSENYNISRPVQVICDNNEKGAVADLHSVYKIKHVYTAYKYDKDMALDQLNDFLSSNRITFLNNKCNPLVEDANNSLWKRDEETDKILHELDDDLYHPNSLMALLYVSRQFAYDVCRYIDNNKQAKNIIEGKDINDNLEEVWNDVF